LEEAANLLRKTSNGDGDWNDLLSRNRMKQHRAEHSKIKKSEEEGKIQSDKKRRRGEQSIANKDPKKGPNGFELEGFRIRICS